MACVGEFDVCVIISIVSPTKQSMNLGVHSRSGFSYVFHLNEHEIRLASVLVLKDVVYTATNQLLRTPQVRRAES